MKSTILLVMSMLYCGSATATIWNVDEVFSGTDGGFGFSLLHLASQSSPMSGTKTADIISASGTYDDSDGSIDFLLGLDVDEDNLVDGTLKLSNLMEGEPLAFDGAGLLNDDAAIKYALSGTTLSSVGTGGFLGFGFGKVCCSGDFAPNSFEDSGSGGLHFLTLWGANILGPTFDGTFDSTTSFGIDLRLGLSPVPVPAAVWLFGTALVGLFGYQRRKVLT